MIIEFGDFDPKGKLTLNMKKGLPGTARQSRTHAGHPVNATCCMLAAAGQDHPDGAKLTNLMCVLQK
jgi:hypothetical protein